jgi:hypothetical protein
MSNETLSETRIILRHAEPNAMDESQYGTACKVMRTADFDLFVQINKHADEKPNWLFVGTFDHRTDPKIIKDEIDNVTWK